ncbi:ABC transporter substrate-binding protein [Vulgatibacter sp.]|uniref:ABC transporter substrate-binding protein n=1 Tax=Vulgatibacter sp. TaxID=1971226 RepID=UPI0035686517
MRTLLALFAVLLCWSSPALAAAPHWLGSAPKGAAQRVVTLAPSLTEIVLDLGRGGALVGVSRYDDAPEVQGLQRVGGFLDPSPEAVLALAPDLVLVQPSPGNRGAVERLAQLGIPVLVLPLDTVAETLEAIRAVGKALGDAASGEALATRIRAAIESTRAAAAAGPQRKALLVYAWKPLVVAGPASFAHELLVAAGGENVAGTATGAYPTLSAEAALAAAPELVVDVTGGHGGGAPIPGLGARVRALRSPGLFRPGPRMVEALRELARLLGEEAPK